MESSSVTANQPFILLRLWRTKEYRSVFIQIITSPTTTSKHTQSNCIDRSRQNTAQSALECGYWPTRINL